MFAGQDLTENRSLIQLMFEVLAAALTHMSKTCFHASATKNKLDKTNQIFLLDNILPAK